MAIQLCFRSRPLLLDLIKIGKMRAILFVLVWITLLAVSTSQEETATYMPDPNVRYPSSHQPSLDGEPTMTPDFDIEKDLSPEDQALIDEANGFLSPDEKEKYCNDWRPDNEKEPDYTASNDSAEVAARKLSIRERLADLDRRVAHTHGRRLCHWDPRSKCGCLEW